MLRVLLIKTALQAEVDTAVAVAVVVVTVARVVETAALEEGIVVTEAEGNLTRTEEIVLAEEIQEEAEIIKEVVEVLPKEVKTETNGRITTLITKTVRELSFPDRFSL
jgi:hypothetical protein